MKTRLTLEQQKYVENNIHNKTHLEIANILGVSKAIIDGFLYRQKIDIVEKWTPEADEYLKQNYLKEKYIDIGKKLGKTKSAISSRVRFLKLKGKGSRHSKGKSNWSDYEIDYLKKNVNSVTYDKISEVLGRSKAAIYNKVYELQLIDDDAKSCRKIKKEQILYIVSNCDIFTDIELARKFNISESRVSEIRKRYGKVKKEASRQKITAIEKIIMEKLDERKISYIYNEKIDNIYPDFQIRNSNIIIEVQGDYFHCNPVVYKNGPEDEIQIKNVLKDYKKKCYYINHGYKVYYLWEKDIIENNSNVDKAINEIYSAVQERSSRKVLE